MIKKIIKTITLSAAIMTTMSVFGHTIKADAANITGTVTVSSLNIRSGAATSYSIVGSLKKGDEVEILSSNNGWYKIQYDDNKTGWSCNNYIKQNESTTSTGTITANSLNVRSGAATSYSIVGSLKKGDEVAILSSSNGWHKIQYSDNKTGWIHGNYVKSSTSTSSDSMQVAKTLDVKAYAYTGDGITATGTKPKYGTLAVDPTVIPYGTRIYIKELDKVFIAEDCGGAIKGNKIDIFMETEAACNNWGIKNITIQILK